MTRLLVALAVGGIIIASSAIDMAAADGGRCRVDITCDGDVVVESEADAIVGTGGMVFPSSFRGTGTTRGEAASCDGCAWQTVSVCVGGDVGTGCAGAQMGCPDGQYRMRVLRRVPPSAEWDYVGDVCVGGGSRPVAVADIAQRVRDRFVDRLPRPDPSYQPADGALVNLPTVFASGQRAGVQHDTFDLLGYAVAVQARPSWTWRFGDGGRLTTDQAGGRYPDTSVSHTYEAAGRRTVTVSAHWTGTFTVDGLGPFDVTGGPVTQSADLTVRVRESGGQLVGSDAS